MEADLQSQVAFFLTGKRSGDLLDAVDGLGLRPALFSGYRDLTRLRYDFPLVLVEDPTDDAVAHSLSGVIDLLLEAVATGSDGDRIRKHVLRLEQGIRAMAAHGASGMLSSLWDKAAAPLASADKLVADSLARARAGLKVDGEVIDCDEGLPSRLIEHAWNKAQKKKTKKFSEEITRLTLKLADILKAEFVNSPAGRSADNLKVGFGTTHAGDFDFDVMSKFLKTSTAKTTAPEENRRKRIRRLLSVLETQRFLPALAGTTAKAAKPYSFAFESCSSALKAYRERLSEAIELTRTIAIAELEVKGEYRESMHDAIFESFGENGMAPSDMAAFPDYLVCVNAGKMQAEENHSLTEILSSGLPMKVLVQTDDIFEESVTGSGHLAMALRSKQLASMAIGLNVVYVLQSASSNLYRFRDRIVRGMSCQGPALFSVFSGAPGKASGLPPYLNAAMAMESRVFPAFTYDPSAGPDWASRFSLDENAQPEKDWPLQGFAYEDDDHQRVLENVPVTLVDFVACDSRHARHFARIPRAKWNGSMMSVVESLDHEIRGLPDQVPYLLMVDGNNVLQKVVVDEKLIREARRCREMWRSLQELGGINNSHAQRLLAREKSAWEEQKQKDEEQLRKEIEARAPVAATVPATRTEAPSATGPVEAAAPAAAAPEPEEAEPEKSSDEAYIETPRCSTCNECTTINNKMFAYNENQQAYIADVNAGTYAQLVEAAESCQVAIIHPGKPRNPNEPGMEELLKRAAAFP